MNKRFPILVGTYDTKYPQEILRSNGIDYIDTAVAYRSEHMVPNNGTKLISKIAPCMLPYYESIMEMHLENLRRSSIEIMLIHNDKGDIMGLMDKLVNDPRIEEVGVSNFSLENLEMMIKYYGEKIRYAEYQVNPYTALDPAIKDLCDAHAIQLIAWGVFGGKYRAAKTIGTYGIKAPLDNIRSKNIIPIINPLNWEQFGIMLKALSTPIEKIDLGVQTYGDFNPMVYNVNPFVAKLRDGGYTTDLAVVDNDNITQHPDFSGFDCLPQDHELIRQIREHANWLTEAMVFLELYIRNKTVDERINHTIDCIKVGYKSYHLNLVREDGTLTKVLSDAKDIMIYAT